MPIRLLDCRRVAESVLLVVSVLGSHAVLAQAPVPPADYSQEAVVIEQARTAIRFEKDGTGRRDTYLRLKTQSEAGVQQFGQLVFGYNAANERPEIAFVRVRKADGTIVATSPESVQDLSSPVQRVAPIYTDFRQKHVTVQSLRPGDTLEFSVTTEIHTPLAQGQFWTEYDFQRDAIVLDEQLTLDVPADTPLTLKTHPGLDPSIRKEGGRALYRWNGSNLKREDENAKSVKSSAPKVAAIRLTTFQSWEQVGRWYADLSLPQLKPTDEIRKKAAELTAGRSSDLEKVEALYDYVATNFRYVSLSLGAGRYQPRPAADVLREQYGDCKDKHTLLASLLEASGLRASAVLINSGSKLDPAFPSPSQFDHVITYAVVGGEEIWADTTTEVAPFRLLASPLRNKQSLVVAAEGLPRLQSTPQNPPMKSHVTYDLDGSLAEGGKLNFHARMAFRGDAELLMRTVFRRTPAAQWKVLVEGFAKAEGAAGDVSNWKVSDPASLKEPFKVEYDLSANRYADWSSSKTSIALPLARSTAFGPGEGDVEDDEPLDLGAAPTELSYRLRLQLAPGVSARPPLPVTVSRDYAEYRATYSSDWLDIRGGAVGDHTGG